jgi:hypothetical protein
MFGLYYSIAPRVKSIEMTISKHNGPIERRQRSARRAPTWTVGLWLAVLSACASRSETTQAEIAPPPVLTLTVVS